MEYELARLNARSFEHLIQSLAAKYLGIGTVIFGDGPDGGREASFTGRTAYDTGDGPWDGYVVVQAKFRQRPLGAPDDGNWFNSELRSELRQFENSSRRKKPEFYIAATNVVLTPDQDRGSKDKALAALNEEAPYLKGNDIWDFDKLRVLLDQSPEIRQTYAAWVTPGDVLTKILEQLEPDPPDFERTLSRYLQQELFADQYANLEQAGHNPDERIPMASVFVDLPVSVRGPESADESESFVAGMLEVAYERLSPSCLGQTSQETDHEALLAPRLGRTVLVGGPGQGKTTLGQFVCQLFRAALILARPANLVDPELASIARLVRDWCERDGYELPRVRRFPVRIVLSELATALLEEDGIESVLDFIADRMATRASAEVKPSLIRRWLEAYPWLLVLDGLDEVPPSSNRIELLAAIRGLMIEIADADADVLVIATTRPQGYSDEFSPKVFEHRSLVPLPPDAALGYASRLADVRFGENPERRARVMTRLEAAVKNETTARLMTSPLQITIMAVLVDRQGQPPQERWSLFAAYYKAIYDRELERGVAQSLVLRDQRTNVDAVHRRVGLLLQAEGERADGTEARLSVDKFRSLIDGHLREEGFKGEQLRTVEDQLVEAAANRLVFLVGLESDRVGFEIRSLQEFMAAEGLMEGLDIEVRDRLSAVAISPSWRNVFLFAAGKCFADRRALRDTIHSLCAEMNESSDDAIRVLRIGSRLACDVLEEGTVRQQPRYEQMFARLALRLLELEPADADDRLAALYTESIAGIYREEIGTFLTSGSFSRRLGAWRCLVSLAARGVDWAGRLAQHEWPTDGMQARQILVAVAGVRSSRAVADFLAKMVLRQPVWEARFLMTRGMRLGRDDTPEWMLTCAQYLGASRGRNFNVAVRLTPASTWLFNLRPLRPMHMLTEGVLDVLDTAHSSWRILHAAMKFEADPSEASAAEVLLMAAEELPTDAYGTAAPPSLGPIGQVETLVRDLPWPLGALIRQASGGEELREWAARVKAGEFGSLSDWESAQERWEGAMFDLREVLHAQDGPLPLAAPSLQILSSGYPAMPARIDEELVRAITAAPYPESEWLASTVLDGLDFLFTFEGELEVDIDVLCQLVALASQGWFDPPLNALEHALAAQEVSERTVSCLEVVGAAMRPTAMGYRGELPNVLRVAASACEQRIAGPGTMCLLVAAGSPDSVPGCETNVLEEKPELRYQLCRVLLTMRPDQESPDDVARALAPLLERSYVVDIVTRFLRRGVPRDEWTQALLLNLLRRYAGGGPVRRAILDSLSEFVDRRMTPLADQSNWPHFGLVESAPVTPSDGPGRRFGRQPA